MQGWRLIVLFGSWSAFRGMGALGNRGVGKLARLGTVRFSGDVRFHAP
jgi:hypothetical protein